jgi:hypothetical protein
MHSSIKDARPTEIYGRLCLIQVCAVRTKRALACACLMPFSMNNLPSGTYSTKNRLLVLQGYVTMAARQGGLQMETSTVQILEEKIASPASPVGLPKPVQRLTGPNSRCHRPQSAHGCSTTVEVEPRPHSTAFSHVLNCLRKACWRRSLSRSVVISVHPEDQQCRLPGPTAVTPRAMDSFAAATARLGSMSSSIWS